MRTIVAAVCLTLLVGLVPVPTTMAADEDQARTFSDAIDVSLDADTVMASALGKSVELATETTITYVELDAAKLAQRELARQHRRDQAAVRRSATGKDRDCQLAALQRAFEQDRARLQADIVAHRLKLGYVDRRKALTKVGDRLGKLARFVGEIAKETLKEAKPELLAMLHAGVASKIAYKALLKHRFKKIARRRLKEEVLAKLTGGRSRQVLAKAADECEEPEEAAADTPQEDEEKDEEWDVALNTGPFVVSGDYGYSDFHGRQGRAVMGWEGMAGKQCSDFEAYNPSPMDPRNEELAPIHVNLRIIPEEERFVGFIRGQTHSDDFSKGGEASGRFRIVVNGVVSPNLEGSGWYLEGKDSYASLYYKADRGCWDGEEGYSVSVSGPGGGPVKITGTIDSGPMDWVLDLQAESQGSAQSLVVDLVDIELGPYMLENTPTP